MGWNGDYQNLSQPKDIDVRSRSPPFHSQVLVTDVVHIHFDGAFVDGCDAIGVIMRDSIMGGLSGKLPISLASVELAEAFAFIYAIRLATLHQISRVNFSDCALLLHKIMQVIEDLSASGSFTDLIKDLLPVFSHYSISYVNRASNAPSHLLASYGLRCPQFIEWTSLLRVNVLAAIAIDTFL